MDYSRTIGVRAARITLRFAACIFVVGCATTATQRPPEQPAQVEASTTPKIRIPFHFSVVQDHGSLLCKLEAHMIMHRFDTITGEVMNVGDAEVIVTGQDGKELFRDRRGLHFDAPPTGTPGETNASLNQVYTWVVADSVASTVSGTAHLHMFYRDNTAIWDTSAPFVFDPSLSFPLRLQLAYEQHGSNSFQLNMNVFRIRKILNEFTPSGLTHDWMILNSDGEPIWQMSFGSMYTQVITPVLPAEPGQQMPYVDHWDGMGNIREGPVLPGYYRLVGIIPSRPEAITDTIPFPIK